MDCNIPTPVDSIAATDIVTIECRASLIKQLHEGQFNLHTTMVDEKITPTSSVWACTPSEQQNEAPDASSLMASGHDAVDGLAMLSPVIKTIDNEPQNSLVEGRVKDQAASRVE